MSGIALTDLITYARIVIEFELWICTSDLEISLLLQASVFWVLYLNSENMGSQKFR